MTFPKVVYQQSINWKLYKEPKMSANIEAQNYKSETYVIDKQILKNINTNNETSTCQLFFFVLINIPTQ